MTGTAPAGAPGSTRPRAFATLDFGTVSTAGAIVGRVGGRWRLLAATALPAGPGPDDVVALLRGRLRAVDPELAMALEPGDPTGSTGEEVATGGGGAPAAGGWPRILARTGPVPTLAVLAATEAGRERLEAVAAAAGWAVTGASAERHDPLAITRSATRPGVACVLAGAGDPADGDERDLLDELAAVALGIAARRPAVPLILAGALGRLDVTPPAGVEVLLAPSATAGDRPGEALRSFLLRLRAGPTDGRRALVRAAASLAQVTGRRIDLVEIGAGGALRVRAEPDPAAPARVRVRDVEAPAAALLAVDGPGVLDRVEAWSTLGLDRARLRDRLAELRLAPWTDLDGDGALLRAATLRAALERLLAATDPVVGADAPDLVVAAGGSWSALPGPAAALVLADVLRRPGAVQLAVDHARLLAPLGRIEDDVERDSLVADLLDDLLLPLGSVVTARGLRAGHSAGRLLVDVDGMTTELELVPGGLSLVDLPPGQTALADFHFRGPIDLGVHAKRVAVPVSGGIAGLLVDLRDVPLHLPERPDRRRELLAAWERALWPERDA